MELNGKVDAPGIKADSKLDLSNSMYSLDVGLQEDWGVAGGVFFASILGAGISTNVEATAELNVRFNFRENWVEYE